MMAGVRLSVACLDLTQERKPRKPKIGRTEAHRTLNREPVYRSKVKVTRPINAVTDNAQYARRGQFS